MSAARILAAGPIWSMDALVVPADPQESVRVIDLHAGEGELRNLQKEVGGLIDIVGHGESNLVINDEGRINGSPVNVRITHWVLNDSTLAKEGRAYEWSVLYGDVVVTGPPDLKGDLTEVNRSCRAPAIGLCSYEVAASWVTIATQPTGHRAP